MSSLTLTLVHSATIIPLLRQPLFFLPPQLALACYLLLLFHSSSLSLRERPPLIHHPKLQVSLILPQNGPSFIKMRRASTHSVMHRHVCVWTRGCRRVLCGSELRCNLTLVFFSVCVSADWSALAWVCLITLNLYLNLVREISTNKYQMWVGTISAFPSLIFYK